MWSLLRKLYANSKSGRVRKALEKALALHCGGEARPDGLFPFTFALRLTVNWRARAEHPWDRDMLEERKAPRLAEQTLHDTDAIERIFGAFPDANILEVNVFENDPASNKVIVSGVILRTDLGRCESSSIGMRLRMLGVSYRLVNYHFEPIGTGTAEPEPDDQVVQVVHHFRPGRPHTDHDGLPTEVKVQSRPQWRDSEHRPNQVNDPRSF